MKDKLKYFISKASIISENVKDNILLKLENKTFEYKLCHGDFHVLNLIQTSNDIKIIDWICASSGNPEADIYRTYLLYRSDLEEFAEHYLNTYCKIMNLDKDDILSWSSIIAGARLGEYVKNEKEKNILLDIVKNNI
jgi:thiamine kinase-like enzyme